MKAHNGYLPNPTASLLSQHIFSSLLPLSLPLHPKRWRRSLFVRSPGIGFDSAGGFSRQGARSPFCFPPAYETDFRSSTSSRPPMMLPDCVYKSCRLFAATTGSFHLRTLFLVASSNLAIIQSPLEALPKYGKGCTITLKCVSNVRGLPYEIAKTWRRSCDFHGTPIPRY